MAKVSVSRQTLPDGRVRWRVRAWIAGERKLIDSFDTRAEADACAEATRESLADEPTAFTLRTWGAKWLDLRETDGAHRSVAKDRSRWARFVSSSWLAEKNLRRIEQIDIYRWLRETMQSEAQDAITTKNGTKLRATGRPVSWQTAKHALNLVKVCFTEAAQHGMITSNPAVGVKMPRVPGTVVDKWTYLTEKEIADLFALPVTGCDHAQDGEITAQQWTILRVQIGAGLRRGELFSLRWKDVLLDGDRPELVIRSSNDGPTKSGAIRRVPMLGMVRDGLRYWRSTRPGVGDGLVFPNPDGGRYSKSYVARWDRVKKQAGITRAVRFHDLRHTCASHLVMGTWGRVWRLEEIKAYLGHTSIIVSQRYAHLSPDALHGAAKATTTGTEVVSSPVVNIRAARAKKRNDG
jgi:integrase